MQLRSLGPHEVVLHRDIRLRALQEAPDAFGEASVFGWARPHRMGRLRLSAPAHRPATLSLYGRAGFRETGIRRPFSTNPARHLVEMEASV